MLNPARIGHRYPTYRYEVSREKIREYALATGVEDPRIAADTGDLVAPPTFAACFTVMRAGAALLDDPELGATPRLLHSAQEYDFFRPVRSGDVLDCTPWIVDVSSRARIERLVLQVDCVDADSGEPVVTGRTTLVFLPPPDGEGGA